VKPGDLFVAVPGFSTDGRKFIAEASSLGAAAVLTTPSENMYVEIPALFSQNLRSDLAVVADRFYGHPSSRLRVAGITGTNGKTTTAYLLATIFEKAGYKWGKIGTIGYEILGELMPGKTTTPGSIELQRFLFRMVEAGLDGCAMEVSSHALEQERTKGVAFSSATFTNLTQDHLDYHENMEKYFSAKARLFVDVPVTIINIDDSYGRKLYDQTESKKMSFATQADGDLKYSCKSMDIDGSDLEFAFGGVKSSFRFPLPGLFNHQNAAAAAATAIGLGLSLDRAVEGLSNAEPVPGRLEKIDMGQPFGIYVDYAHTPDALERLLSSLRRFNPARLHIVFGCGGDRDKTKRPVMAETASRLADRVYLTSDNPRTEDPRAIIEDALKGITDRRKCMVMVERPGAIQAAVSEASAGDIVVIAGKGHEEYQIVGGVRKYFSDFEVTRSALRKMGYADDD
jgi:UDP-N-acetylmuramoyl-L-alanyl-D-glutamate--2,6-diaminopimelate ligase